MAGKMVNQITKGYNKVYPKCDRYRGRRLRMDRKEYEFALE